MAKASHKSIEQCYGTHKLCGVWTGDRAEETRPYAHTHIMSHINENIVDFISIFSLNMSCCVIFNVAGNQEK